MMQKIVVFATSFLDELPTAPPDAGGGAGILATLDVPVEYRCDREPSKPLTPEELEGVQAIIADLEQYDAELLGKIGKGMGGDLELIVRYGVGVDSVDIDAATEAGVLVANTPGANSRPTAEWAVSTLLDIAGRRMPHHRRAAAGKAKEGPSRLDVTGRTLGIVGTGAIGRHVEELLSGFNMRVLAYDPYPQREWATERGVDYASFPEVCSDSDFITLHAATKKQIIGSEELALMRPTTALVNCARGILVDNRAAYDAVRAGKLWGYGLDEIWPHPELSLEGLNIAVSPHVGSDTDSGKARMQLYAARAIAAYLAGEAPSSLLNPSAAQRSD